MRRTLHLWLSVLLLNCPGLADEPLETDLEETVAVSAPRPVGEDVAAFATTIVMDEVADRGRDLADMLHAVPGARVRDYGGLGSSANLSLRASTFEQVTLLVDGVRQNRALGGPVDLSSIPATQIERITVFRGFGPAAYGLGGIGGVVDVRTRPPEDVSGRIDALAGELNTKRLSADLAVGRSAAGSLAVGFEGLQSDGDFLFLDSNATLHTQDDDEMTRRRNNDREQTNLWIRWMREGAERGRSSASLRLQQRDHGVPTVENQQSETARLTNDLYDLTASWARSDVLRLDDVDLQFNAFHEELGFADPLGDLGPPSISDTRLRGLSLAALLRKRVGRHGLLWRVETRRETARVVGENDRNYLALTVEDIMTLGRLTLAPAARWDRRREDFGAARAGDDALSGKLGAAYRVGRRVALRGSAGRFHRDPNLLELFGDRGSVVGDTGLRPERGIAVELGLAASDPRSRSAWGFEVVGFARRTDDLIWYIQKSAGVSKAVNLARAEVLGLELSGRLRLTKSVTLDAGATLQDATDASGGFPDGHTLPYNPSTLGYLGLAFERGGLRCRWDVAHVGRNGVDQLDTPELRIPSREIHDLNVAYGWADGIRLGLDVRNLFDTRTLDFSRYPLPRRVLSLHLGWRSDPGGRNG